MECLNTQMNTDTFQYGVYWIHSIFSVNIENEDIQMR